MNSKQNNLLYSICVFPYGSLFRLKTLKLLVILFFLCDVLSVNASAVETLKITSKSMGKDISNIVIIPDAYTQTKNKFPVLYLLHGAGGNYTDWLSRVPDIKLYADMYNIIIVCPDGALSWYMDSPIYKKTKYETYISKELIAAIDDKYRTRAERQGRVITGLSMGGHGSFYLAFRNQDVWGAAGSMSGGLDIRPFPNNWGLSNILGNFSKHQENWDKNTVVNMVYLLKGDNLKLIFDCGIDDFFYDSNKRLHAKLMERKIPHDFIVRPGTHNWDYWTNSIKYQLLFFNNYLAQKKD